MPADWLQPILDPTAPLPAGWPAGAPDAFLLIFIPIGGGIPLATGGPRRPTGASS